MWYSSRRRPFATAQTRWHIPNLGPPNLGGNLLPAFVEDTTNDWPFYRVFLLWVVPNRSAAIAVDEPAACEHNRERNHHGSRSGARGICHRPIRHACLARGALLRPSVQPLVERVHHGRAAVTFGSIDEGLQLMPQLRPCNIIPRSVSHFPRGQVRIAFQRAEKAPHLHAGLRG
jgi:hypothetical protein